MKTRRLRNKNHNNNNSRWWRNVRQRWLNNNNTNSNSSSQAERVRRRRRSNARVKRTKSHRRHRRCHCQPWLRALRRPPTQARATTRRTCNRSNATRHSWANCVDNKWPRVSWTPFYSIKTTLNATTTRSPTNSPMPTCNNANFTNSNNPPSKQQPYNTHTHTKREREPRIYQQHTLTIRLEK